MKRMETRSKRTKSMWLSGWVTWLLGLGLGVISPVDKQVRGQSNPVFSSHQLARRQPIGRAALSDSLPADKSTEVLLRSAAGKGSAGNWAGAVSDLSKEIAYAPDSLLAMPYAQRSALYYARKQHVSALADLDSAIVHTPQLRYGRLISPGSITARLRAHWKQRGHILADMGQFDVALASLAQSERLLAADPFARYPESVGSNEVDRGRYLTLQGNLTAADSSYRKAIDAYETSVKTIPTYVGQETRLKIVELCLLTGQYDRARQQLRPLKLLNSQPNKPIKDGEDTIYELTDKKLRSGYDTLCEYLSHCLAILNGSKTSAQALIKFRAYCDAHRQTLYYPFTLTDAWLAHKKVDTQKINSFRRLQDAAKSRLIQP